MLILCLAGFDRATAPGEETTSPAAQAVQFGAVEVYVDPQGQPLAAYQVEIIALPQGVKLVGIEGGDAAAFHDPPHYDPRALMGSRIIIAAFNLEKDLPTQKTRVATLMFQIPVGARPSCTTNLQVVASPEGRIIHADVSLIEKGAAP